MSAAASPAVAGYNRMAIVSLACAVVAVAGFGYAIAIFGLLIAVMSVLGLYT